LFDRGDNIAPEMVHCTVSDAHENPDFSGNGRRERIGIYDRKKYVKKKT
jgi:hypothetical protein